ncbi:predicted protein [Nematostella vectensis]|uniref:RING-type domain-containing protein n=1 Tax=Nematostella vectensis TaxID=45351 RepID=A7RKP3_NEMVE|nr:predicted protein [Nematostella vectensis]|eukprot:XP_001640006.1 predicted protein [Nematostella vectensis]
MEERTVERMAEEQSPLPPDSPDKPILCSICFEEVQKETSAELKCGHENHLECVLRLRSTTCLVCRRELESDKLGEDDLDEMRGGHEEFSDEESSDGEESIRRERESFHAYCLSVGSRFREKALEFMMETGIWHAMDESRNEYGVPTKGEYPRGVKFLVYLGLFGGENDAETRSEIFPLIDEGGDVFASFLRGKTFVVDKDFVRELDYQMYLMEWVEEERLETRCETFEESIWGSIPFIRRELGGHKIYGDRLSMMEPITEEEVRRYTEIGERYGESVKDLLKEISYKENLVGYFNCEVTPEEDEVIRSIYLAYLRLYGEVNNLRTEREFRTLMQKDSNEIGSFLNSKPLVVSNDFLEELNYQIKLLELHMLDDIHTRRRVQSVGGGRRVIEHLFTKHIQLENEQFKIRLRRNPTDFEKFHQKQQIVVKNNLKVISAILSKPF